MDVSPIYFFYDDHSSDTMVVNENNRISTTNWIFHIDKRLPLRTVIPEVIRFQEKRKKASLHKNESARNYFSVNDTVTKSLGFIDFTQQIYLRDSLFSKFYIKERPDQHMSYFNVTVNYKLGDSITVDGNTIERNELESFLKEYIDFSAEGKSALVYLNFDQRLDFQTFLTNTLMMERLKNNNINISETIFIYDKTLLPDCNCSL
ncbi:hypothetical protein ACFQ1M_06475 [Sungkyunkwania multivorans]|uniref:Uncharacterized protein n=1 Tax=Sungkyunkwania multivorans TaxID=1173618 RepID=A0ABW3CVR6_9FLAO